MIQTVFMVLFIAGNISSSSTRTTGNHFSIHIRVLSNRNVPINVVPPHLPQYRRWGMLGFTAPGVGHLTYSFYIRVCAMLFVLST